jgi:hypothetical protein
LELSTAAKPLSVSYGSVVGPVDPVAIEFLPADCHATVTDISAYLLTKQNYGTVDEPQTHPTWVDLAGPGDGSPPDYDLNVTDLQVLLFGISGDPWGAKAKQCNPGACPGAGKRSDPQIPPMLKRSDPGSVARTDELARETVSPSKPAMRLSDPGRDGGAEFVLAPDTPIIEAGATVDIEVFTTSLANVGAYEVALVVSGGTAGALELKDIEIDAQHPAFVFATESSVYSVVNTSYATASCATGCDGVEVVGEGYLATYTYQASADADGVFTIGVKGDGASFVNDDKAILVSSDPGSAIAIGVAIDCFEDGDCDDDNDCTTDTCVDHECVYDNLAQGAFCNDRLFCTRRDRCDGNGTCVGSGNACLGYDFCKECGGGEGCCWNAPVECNCEFQP